MTNQGSWNITADGVSARAGNHRVERRDACVFRVRIATRRRNRRRRRLSDFETDASDEDITSVDGNVDVTKHSRAFEALTASQFEADVALGAVLGKGASATVRAGTWTRRPSWTTASKPDVEPVPVFEKVAVKLFEPTDRNVDRKGSASFENELRVLRIIGGGKPSRLVAALAACADAGAVPEEEKRKMAENKTFPRVRAILMPLLDGGSLHDALRRAAETENPYETFPLAARLRALTHVASALRYLHDMGADLFASRSGRERRAADAREPGFASGFPSAPRRQAEERAA